MLLIEQHTVLVFDGVDQATLSLLTAPIRELDVTAIAELRLSDSQLRHPHWAAPPLRLRHPQIGRVLDCHMWQFKDQRTVTRRRFQCP